MELMVFLNRLFYINQEQNIVKEASIYHEQVDSILTYINQNMKNALSIQELSEHFFLSTSYLCRIFKAATGTTINKYITAKRITNAKSLLSQGYSVGETCELCGFRDYSNFLKSFTKAVGISPKKYARFVS
jgi:AraC-like DNA-binding protein